MSIYCNNYNYRRMVSGLTAVLVCAGAMSLAGCQKEAIESTESEAVVLTEAETQSLYEEFVENIEYPEIPEEISLPGTISIPEIVLTEIDSLPASEDIAKFTTTAVGKNPKIFFFDDCLDFYFSDTNSESGETMYYSGTLPIPAGYTFSHIYRAAKGGGSGEVDIMVEVTKDSETLYLIYAFMGLQPPTEVVTMYRQ